MTKKRSKLIIQLIKNEINVLQAMQLLSLMLEDLESEEIKKWLLLEMNGYGKEDIVPDYRKVRTTLIGKIQVYNIVYPEVNIPLNNKEAQKFFSEFEEIEPLSSILQYANSEKEQEGHILHMEADLNYVNKFKSTNGTVISARREMSMYSMTNIVEMIKTKLIDILKELEKNYGNLDECYIDFSDEDLKENTINHVINIIYNDSSTSFGDNNTIKNSIVGDNNE